MYIRRSHIVRQFFVDLGSMKKYLFVFLLLGVCFGQIQLDKSEDKSLFAKSFLFLIDLYQKHSSKVVASFCPMYPSCSQYSKEAVGKYDIKGILMIFDRLHRCSHDLKKYELVFVNGEIKYLDKID